ncbi:peptidylprolyl isomerase, partial [Gammaproteobacteria bacterium]|nr:peptidylprolyl isomerase [Gammaproteobacteria bacterium]
LKKFDDVKKEVATSLSKSKTTSKKLLLVDEIIDAKQTDDGLSFISAYDFISTDAFIGVKRGSSLLPQEVISEAFKVNPGISLTTFANNGDAYIIDVASKNKPTNQEINNIIEQYKKFSEDRYVNLLTELISNDIFNTSQVNLNNLVF